ncbi:MAG: hypothetical protein PHC53_02235 [Patescibacteria group bacterium]|nr:hypothetical protein [Patescibacteria group bacterium]
MQRVSPSERTLQGKIQPIFVPVNQGTVSWARAKGVDPVVLKVVINNGVLSRKLRRATRDNSKAAEPHQLHVVEPLPEVIEASPPTLQVVEESLVVPEIIEEVSAFQPPSQGVVRGIASLAVKQLYNRFRKTPWGKMVHAYCSGMVGPAKRGREVERYVIEYLNRAITEWLKANLAMSHAEVKAGLVRKAALALDEIEDVLCSLVKTQGHPPKASSTQFDYKVVIVSLGFKTKREVFVLFEIHRTITGVKKKAKTRWGLPKYKYETEIEIVSVKSARDFRRGVRNRFTRQERERRQRGDDESLDFRNVPRVMRH